MLAVVKCSTGDELDVFADRDKERVAVYIHDVHT